MTTIAMLGAGIMASALTVPLADNGHDVRLVGTHLDTDIIDSVKATRIHPGLQRKLPEAVHAYQLEEAETAFDGAEMALSGVNSFGVRWAGQELTRLLRPGMLVIAIAKGMEASEKGTYASWPRSWPTKSPKSCDHRFRGRRSAARRSPARSPSVATHAWSSPAGTRRCSTGSPRCSAPTTTTYGPPPTSSASRCVPR